MKSVSATTKVLASFAGLAVSGACFAQATWNWGDPGGCDPATCTVSGVTATVTAFGSEGSGNFFQSAVVRDLDPNSGNGLGIKSAGESDRSPNHAIDNFGTDVWVKTGWNSGYWADGGATNAEMLAINFSQAVALTQVAVSWTYTDSDALIFRYDGTGAPPSLTTITASALPTTVGGMSSGWTLVSAGQFATGSKYNGGSEVGSIKMAPNLSSANSYSSYWLVSTAFGGNDDGFKLLSFSGHIKSNGGGGGGGSVPEPGSLGLAAAAFVGLVASRRRKTVHR